MLKLFKLEALRKSGPMRVRITDLYAALLALGAWIWPSWCFMTTRRCRALACSPNRFGLRHAVDAGHIAAIDKVTRMLIQIEKRPVR